MVGFRKWHGKSLVKVNMVKHNNGLETTRLCEIHI